MNVPRSRLILFTRHPQPGRVKTRLIPALGAEGSAALHRRLTWRALRTGRALATAGVATFEVRYDGGDESAMRHWIGPGFELRAQHQGDLGRRLAGAFQSGFEEGATAIVIIGADCPTLRQEHLQAAFDALTRHDVVFGPATDGGYYLVGLRRFVPELFQDIAWGTEVVLEQSRRAAARAGHEPFLLEPLDDIDRPEDLAHWERIVTAEAAGELRRLAVIIPAWNEALNIEAAVTSAQQAGAAKVIVVDGGSTDDTAARAGTAGASVLESAPGRATQMNAGAAVTEAGTLLFLHADTMLPAGGAAAVAQALGKTGVAGGAFRFQVTGTFPGRRLLEWGANARSRLARLPYGDQALFLRRSTFEELGGFPNLPILEDYELVRRLRRRGRVVTLSLPALTSGRRWERLGFLRTTWINQRVLFGYHAGEDPARLARLYQQANR